MDNLASFDARRRNRNYEDTHRVLIEKAVELIARRGADAVSVSALARETGINRSTVYYHFRSRQELVRAVHQWASEQIALGLAPGANQRERMVRIQEFIAANPELMKLWVDEFVSAGTITERFAEWDALVATLSLSRPGAPAGGPIDAPVFATMLLAASLVAPRVFALSVEPNESRQRIVARFVAELQRLLAAYSLLLPA